MARRIAPHGLRDRAGAAARRRAAHRAEPPRGDERLEHPVRPGPAERRRGRGRRRRGARGRDHRRRPGLLLRRRPQGRLRPHALRHARRPHRADRPLPPDHHRHPAHAQARRGRRQRPGRRDRPLARARRRPRDRARERLLPARVREHRPRARRRLLAVRARARRVHARDRDGDARRAGERAPGARVGPDQPRRGRRRVRGGGRRARRSGSPRARPAPTRAPSASSTRGSTRRMDEQLELEADDPAGVRGDRRLPRGRHGLRGEAPAHLRRIDERRRDAARSGLRAPYTPPPHAEGALHPRPDRGPGRPRAGARRCERRHLLPGEGRLGERGQDLDALPADLRPRLDRLHRRGGARWCGRCSSSAPARAWWPPRSTATRAWRSAGPSAPA